MELWLVITLCSISSMIGFGIGVLLADVIKRRKWTHTKGWVGNNKERKNVKK